MLQDIYPHNFNNEFKSKNPENQDYLMVFNGESILMDKSSGKRNFTAVEQIKKLNPEILQNAIYLFSIDDSSFFCAFGSIKAVNAFKYIKIKDIRKVLPDLMTFTAITAYHLAKWYDTNKFCGKCAKPMEFSTKERALYCSKCDLIKYPNISPAVIVGVISKDKILLTRYADRPYKKLSLVAGFVEIGETLEDAVKREVKEEVGLSVKNLRYFKSQPWAFSQSLLMGFFAEIDGTSVVTIDETELSEAVWYERGNIPPCETTSSLTNEMIEFFRNNEINCLKSI